MLVRKVSAFGKMIDAKRGALVVLEGCDRVGKSTQVKKLVEALNDRGISTESRRFPDRKTNIGELIGRFLSHKEELSLEAVHLLFSANRWECSNEMVKTLQAGTTLIVDRYAASGAAYTAANTGRKLSWCKEPDRGLPRPDLVFLLEADEKALNIRSGWGQERFEREDIQRKVSVNFHKLKDATWRVTDANRNVDDIHRELFDEVLAVVKNIDQLPLGKLYDD